MSDILEKEVDICEWRRLIDNIFQGWNAYTKWTNSYKLRKQLLSEILNRPTPKDLNIT